MAPHLVAAITHDGATVLGQRRIDSKSNEIPAVRRLLATIDVAGAVVTVDAMHTQKATARYLRQRCKADYVMTVKANQPRLLGSAALSAHQKIGRFVTLGEMVDS